MNHVCNQPVFDKPETTAKYANQARGGADRYVASSSRGVEYWGQPGGIKFPKVVGLEQNEIVYRIAGARGGKTDNEIAENVVKGDWWIAPEFVDHLNALTRNVTPDEMKELFGSKSQQDLFVQMWRANLAIAIVPEKPFLVKCRVNTPMGIFAGKGNPVAPRYAKEFPILGGSQLFDQFYIPGNKSEDGDWNQPVFDITKNLDVMDVKGLY